MQVNIKTIATFVILYYALVGHSNVPKYDKVVFYNVGQGDASLIKYQGHDVLIDGGPLSNLESFIQYDIYPFSCHVDLMIISHPHADHLSGLERLFRRCNVFKVWFDTPGYGSTLSNTFEVQAEKVVEKVFAKSKYQIGNLHIYVVWPPEEFTSDKNINNSSIVVLVKLGSTEILYMGDLEEEAIKKLDIPYLLSLIEPPLDIYKVSHHGARNGHVRDFLLQLKPENCVISVGVNSYGHPNQEVLADLEKLQCKIYRTDKDGSIEFLLE